MAGPGEHRVQRVGQHRVLDQSRQPISHPGVPYQASAGEPLGDLGRVELAGLPRACNVPSCNRA